MEQQLIKTDNQIELEIAVAEEKRLSEIRKKFMSFLYDQYVLYIQSQRYHLSSLEFVATNRLARLFKLRNADKLAERFLLMDFELSHTQARGGAGTLIAEITTRLKSEFAIYFEDKAFLEKVVIE